MRRPLRQPVLLAHALRAPLHKRGTQFCSRRLDDAHASSRTEYRRPQQVSVPAPHTLPAESKLAVLWCHRRRAAGDAAMVVANLHAATSGEEEPATRRRLLRRPTRRAASDAAMFVANLHPATSGEEPATRRRPLRRPSSIQRRDLAGDHPPRCAALHFHQLRSCEDRRGEGALRRHAPSPSAWAARCCSPGPRKLPTTGWRAVHAAISENSHETAQNDARCFAPYRASEKS